MSLRFKHLGIAIYKWGNFMYHDWGFTLIYWLLSYPFRSLGMTYPMKQLPIQSFSGVINHTRKTNSNTLLFFLVILYYILANCYNSGIQRRFKGPGKVYNYNYFVGDFLQPPKIYNS